MLPKVILTSRNVKPKDCGMKALKVAIWFGGAVVAAVLFVAGAQSPETNSSPVDIFVQPIKTHLESREEVIRQLRAEVVQLHNQIASMPTPPLPVYVPDILHIRQLDTNTWRLTLSDGYEFVQLKATNGVSVVVFLQRK